MDGAGLLSAATALSGVLAYAFHVLAARTLGPTSYGLVAVLWAAMFLLVVLLFRPIEQTASRAIADRRARGAEVHSVVRAVGVLYVGIMVVVGIASAAAWQPVTERLFVGDTVFTAALVAGVTCYGVQYLVRGLCGGVRWFQGYGLALLADGATRLAVLAPVAIGASRSMAAAAVAAAAAGGAVAPLYAGKRRLGSLRDRGEGKPFRLGTATRFAAPAAVIAGADQVIVNGGPLLVMLDGGSGSTRVAGVVFAATMLVRVPVFLFQGIAASLLPNLTLLQAAEERVLFRRAVARAALMLTGGAAAIAAVAGAIGPEAMRIIYGSGFDAGRLELALLGVGVGLYLATATVSQGMLALDAVRTAAAAWAAAAAVFVLGYLVLPGGELIRIAIAFCASMGFCLAILTVSLGRRLKH